MPSLVEIGPVILEKKIFFNFVNVFLLFHNYFPLEKDRAPHLKKLESSSAIVPSLVENGTLVLEKKIFFNFLNVFSLFPNYLPLKKGGALNPLHPRMLLAKFGCFGPRWFWRRRWKCGKFTTTTTTTTTRDTGQILIRKAHLSLQLRWAKSD